MAVTLTYGTAYESASSASGSPALPAGWSVGKPLICVAVSEGLAPTWSISGTGGGGGSVSYPHGSQCKVTTPAEQVARVLGYAVSDGSGLNSVGYGTSGDPDTIGLQASGAKRTEAIRCLKALGLVQGTQTGDRKDFYVHTNDGGTPSNPDDDTTALKIKASTFIAVVQSIIPDSAFTKHTYYTRWLPAGYTERMVTALAASVIESEGPRSVAVGGPGPSSATRVQVADDTDATKRNNLCAILDTLGLDAVSSGGNVTVLRAVLDTIGLPIIVPPTEKTYRYPSVGPYTYWSPATTDGGGTNPWVKLGEITRGTNLHLVAWGKTAESGEAAPTVSTGAAAANLSAVVAQLDGCAASWLDADVVTGTGAAASSYTPPGITTATDGALAMQLSACSSRTTVTLSPTNGFATSYTDSYDVALHTLTITTKTVATKGASSAPTLTGTSSGQWAALTLAVRAAAVVTPGAQDVSLEPIESTLAFGRPWVKGTLDPGIWDRQSRDLPAHRAQIIDVPWSACEPSQGVYDWSAIEAKLPQAFARGQKVHLRIKGGVYAPDWVKTAAGSFTIENQEKPGTFLVQPKVWTTVYGSLVDAFAVAAADKWDRDPRVCSVQVSLVMEVHGEPFVTWETNYAAWLAAGYNQTQHRQRLIDQGASFAAAFRQTPITYTYNQWATANGQQTMAVTEALIRDTVTAMLAENPKHIFLQNHGVGRPLYKDPPANTSKWNQGILWLDILSVIRDENPGLVSLSGQTVTTARFSILGGFASAKEGMEWAVGSAVNLRMAWLEPPYDLFTYATEADVQRWNDAITTAYLGVTSDQARTLTGIPSTVSFGELAVTYDRTVQLTGIPSTARVGRLRHRLEQSRPGRALATVASATAVATVTRAPVVAAVRAIATIRTAQAAAVVKESRP